MLFEFGVTRHGRFINSNENFDPNREHNRTILRSIIGAYLFQKGELKKTYGKNDVPVYGVAPYGQVMFCSESLFKEKMELLEKQVGNYYMSRIEVACGAEFSETEARARRIVASWK